MPVRVSTLTQGKLGAASRLVQAMSLANLECELAEFVRIRILVSILPEVSRLRQQ